MPLADSSRAQVRYIKETVFGVTPGTGNSKNLRVTGETLKFDVTKETSKELRSDRQLGHAVPVSAGASGDLNFHFLYAEYDDLIASTLQNDWAVFGTNGVGATFTADFTTNTITASVAPTTTSAFTNLARGQWFKLLAPGSVPNNNKWLRVSLTTAPTATVITLDANTPLTAATAVTLNAIATSRLSNGVIQTSFSIEKEMPDVAQLFMHTGMTPGRMQLNFASAALTDWTLSFMGKTVTRSGVSAMPGTPIASTSYGLMNGATGINQLWEAGVPLTTVFIKSLTLNVDNAQRSREALGNYGYVSIGSGTLAVTGTLELYFSDGSMYDKFVNNVYTSLICATRDDDGNGYVFTMPRLNLMNATITAGAKDQDIMASFDVQAFSDDANAIPALRKTLFIDRLGAAVTP